jgi:hypothetical protein
MRGRSGQGRVSTVQRRRFRRTSHTPRLVVGFRPGLVTDACDPTAEGAERHDSGNPSRDQGPDLALPRRWPLGLVQAQGSLWYERAAWRFDRR